MYVLNLSRKIDSLQKAGRVPGGAAQTLRRWEREQFSCMLEITKRALQLAIKQLGAAFKNFWTGRAKSPKCCKKGVHEYIILANDQFFLEGCRICIPKQGWVQRRESLQCTGMILSATIFGVAEVSVMAKLSMGEKVIGLKPHKALLKRLRQLFYSLLRKHHDAKRKLGLTGNALVLKGTQLPVSENAKKPRAKLPGSTPALLISGRMPGTSSPSTSPDGFIPLPSKS
ncbi:hypothetical protein A7K93_03285 [Candidatus Methylacidiphilum fumarolicum]|nr:hypothetical protein A7K73_06615 [Candidatus Methylacidiphilum fumarolicum]TFE72780.1 hypothetical protein A7K72_07610 [Candidatus Methylacidiphilum fumarolicum]TFE74683.1 hypothetical protein A7K93_03285 [Candidatus Methylacidiphilum fumarolicum]TFE77740.1 hypothetical protein A7D33_03315 [Candidatus Methylacidiphilum fumarolicum]